MNSKIIGITGKFGGGKSTAAAFFALRGFDKIILSDFLEKEAVERGLPITRKVLQDIGNAWREKFGSHILAEKSIKEIKDKKLEKIVIDGIRNVSEINYFRKNENFILLAIGSSRKNRFERLQKVKRREEMTWELFEKLDDRDSGIGEKETGLQVEECMKLADYSIQNDGTEDEFKDNLEKLLNKI